MLSAALSMALVITPSGASEYATLQGRAVDSISGGPVEKAAIRVAKTAGTTDSTGAFHFKQLPPGTHEISGTKNGYLGSDAQIITLKAGDALDQIKIELTPGAIISGNVLDEEGDPVPEARVNLWTDENGPADSVETNSQGEFELTGLGAGSYSISAAPPI